MRHNLDALFYPNSVAVIGLSEAPEKQSHYPVKSLMESGFAGKIYPVHPHLSRIYGRKVYASVKDIPNGVDLAMIVMPAQMVPSALEDCVRKGIRGAVILSGGFKESGLEAGASLQEEIVTIADRAGIRIIGPNSVGLMNTYNGLNTTFEPSFNDACKGNIAVVSQSGGVCSFLLHSMIDQNLGVSLTLSLGNRGNVDFPDIIEYLGEHEPTRVITLYIEGLDNPRRFIEVARKVAGKKPIVACTACDESFSQATCSHTGALAGNPEVYNTALSQAGIILADDLTGLMDMAKTLAFQPLARGNRVAILSPQAGPGIVAAHACRRYGLVLADFSPEGKKELEEVAGTPFFSQNPFDLGAPFIRDTTGAFHKVLEILLNEEGVDALIMSGVHHPLFVPFIDSFINIVEERELPKPVVIFGTSPRAVADRQISRLERNSIPVYPFPERAVKALSGLVRYGEVLKKASQ